MTLSTFFLSFILRETCTKEAAKPFHPLYSRNWTIYSHIQRHRAFFFLNHTFIYLKQPATTSVYLRGTIENKIAVSIIKCVCFGGLVWVWVLNVCSCFLTLQMSVLVPSASLEFLYNKTDKKLETSLSLFTLGKPGAGPLQWCLVVGFTRTEPLVSVRSRAKSPLPFLHP